MVAIIIISLLFAAILLLCTPREERALAFGSMLAIGAAFWFAIQIRLHTIVAGILDFFMQRIWENRMDLLIAFGIAVVFIVPLMMIYVELCDHLERREMLATSRKLRRLPRTDAANTNDPAGKASHS